MKTAIGLDLYNQVTTGQKTMTLCCARSDPQHVPCVLVSVPSTQPKAEASDTRESGVQRSEPVQSRQYYMTDKAGHMCRWKLLDKAMTLQASDYKDPPSILTTCLQRSKGEQSL